MLLTPRQIGIANGVTERTVERWITRDGLPVAERKPGKRGAYILDTEIVASWLRDRPWMVGRQVENRQSRAKACKSAKAV